MGFVVGIDIGNENCVVAVYNNKGGFVDVLLNEASKRETPLLIHFDKKQRMFGSAGTSYSSRDPKASISQLKRLIGRRFDEKSFEEERKLLPYRTSGGPKGEILVSVNYQNQEWELTAVELLGMFLSHLKKTVEKVAGDEITDCVIGVPSYLTNQQRKDYLLAAKIAGLKPLRLFHDGTATALDYAFSRELSYGNPIHVVFVDIGHCDTQVTVVKFSCGTLTVLAHSFDRQLGGRDFDNIIFEHIIERIDPKHRGDILKSEKASFQLRAACVKAKMVLSVNTEATVSKDCLINDIDVEEVITREKFETMSADLLKRIVDTCANSLIDARIHLEDIYSIELVGSGSRIPKISQFLEDFFKRKVSRTLNASECIANGCALQCAMLCPTLKARTFGVQDMYPFSIGFKMYEDACVEPRNIFNMGWPFLDVRTLIFPSFGSLIFDYVNSRELADEATKSVTKFTIKSADQCREFALRVKFELDLHGILRVHSAYVNDNGLFKQKSFANLEQMGIDVVSGCLVTAESECSLQTRQEHETTCREKIEISTFHLVKILETPLFDVPDVLSHAIAKELAMEEYDKASERAKNLRNELEAYLLNLRNMVLGKSVRLASEEKKAALVELLHGTEDWLYGSGADGSEQDYIMKGNTLREIFVDLRNEHNHAHQVAINKRKMLIDLGKNISNKIYRAEFGDDARKPEFIELSTKLKMIANLVKEAELRSADEYTQEIDEVTLLYHAFQNCCDSEAEKGQFSGSNIIQAGKHIWNRFRNGAGPGASPIKGGHHMPQNTSGLGNESCSQSPAADGNKGNLSGCRRNNVDSRNKNSHVNQQNVPGSDFYPMQQRTSGDIKGSYGKSPIRDRNKGASGARDVDAKNKNYDNHSENNSYDSVTNDRNIDASLHGNESDGHVKDDETEALDPSQKKLLASYSGGTITASTDKSGSNEGQQDSGSSDVYYNDQKSVGSTRKQHIVHEDGGNVQCSELNPAEMNEVFDKDAGNNEGQRNPGYNDVSCKVEMPSGARGPRMDSSPSEKSAIDADGKDVEISKQSKKRGSSGTGGGSTCGNGKRETGKDNVPRKGSRP